MWTDVDALKGHVPLYCEDDEVDFEHPLYADYFRHYHFAQLAGFYDRYHLGVIESEHAFVCHHWRCENAKRTVLVVHGLFDHVGLFLPLIRYLLSQSYSVVAMELPDHGLSPQKYGSLADFKGYSKAVSALFESAQITLEGPVTAIGQSTGGAVLFDFVSCAGSASRVDQLVLLAPLLRVRSWRLIKVTYFLLHMFLKRVPRGFSGNSHDEDFCAFMKHDDPLQPHYVSVDWVGAMLDWENQFQSLNTSALPSLLIQGTADNTVDFNFNLPCYASKLNNLRVEMVEGAMHHLVGEADPWRSQVYELLGRFIGTSD